MLLHGRDNGLVDVWTQRLLGAHLGAAGVPVKALTCDGLGHQDVWIGRRSAEVCAEVGQFLDGPCSGAMQVNDDGPGNGPDNGRSDGQADSLDPGQADGRAEGGADWILRPAALGPRLDVAHDTDGRTIARVAAMPPLTEGVSHLGVLPVRWHREGQGATGRLTAWRLRLQAPGLIQAEAGPARRWQFLDLSTLTDDLAAGGHTTDPSPSPRLFPDGAAPFTLEDEDARHAAPDPRNTHTGGIGEVEGWWVGFLTARDQSLAADLDRPWPDLQGSPPWHAPTGRVKPTGTSDGEPSLADACHALQTLTDTTQAPHLTEAERLNGLSPWLAGLVRSERLKTLQVHLMSQSCRPVTIALGSCQYPHGPLDGGPAQASLNRLADDAEAGTIDLVLLMGDQIYADATAGLVDPRVRDDRYVIPHERAQAAQGLQRVLALAPTVMLADDHEVQDNWRRAPRDRAVAALRNAFGTLR